MIAGALAEEVFGVLHSVGGRLGVNTRGAQLLRLRSNAVFKLRSGVIVRITATPDLIPQFQAGLAVARWLARRGFPSVRPADDISDEPIEHGGRIITFWQYVPVSGRPTTRELGRILRHLHRQPVPPFPVKRLADPLAEVRGAVESRSEVLTPDQRAWLRDRIDELTERWNNLDSCGPPVLLHGDAWIDNLLRRRDGHALLCDWDGVAVGPREWDLVHTYHGQRRFGLSEWEVDAFARSYGSDLREWPGFGTLMEIRDMYAIGIHIRNAAGDPFSRRELPRRLESLTKGDGNARWYMAEPPVGVG